MPAAQDQRPVGARLRACPGRRTLAGRAAALAVAAALVLAGCGTGQEDESQVAADPYQLVRILPSRPGITDAGPPRRVGPDGLTMALLGRADPGLSATMVDQGLKEAAVREWRGPGGRRLVVATSVWLERRGAFGLLGAAAEDPLGRAGARPWTPSQFNGSRGVRVGPPSPPERTLSATVGRTGLFVRATGPVGDEAVLRTMELLKDAAEAGK